MKKAVGIIALLFMAGWDGLFAQAPAPASAPSNAPQAVAEKAGPNLDSPRSTMMTFIHSMNKTGDDSLAWDAAFACLDLKDLNLSLAEQRARATFLLGILNRIERIELDYLWGPEDIPKKKERFVYFPNRERHGHIPKRVRAMGEIALAKRLDGNWVFDADTIAIIPELYEGMKDMERIYGKDEMDLNPSMWLRSKVPESLKRRIISFELWQFVGLFLVILFGVVVDHLIRFFLKFSVKKMIERRGGSAKLETIALAVRPLGLLVAALIWSVLLRLLGFTGVVEAVLLGAARVFATIAAAWTAWRGVDLISEVAQSKASNTDNKMDDVLVPLVRKAAKIFVVVIGVVYVAQSLHISIGPFLASLGIGGLAFAFAAKDTVENFFGSVSVILDRPFNVGDWVVIGDVEGTVEELGFRSTRIRTFYDSQMTVANSTLVRATVDNYGRRTFRRWSCHIGIEYATPPEKVLAFCEGIRELVRSHPYTRKDSFHVYLNKFGPSSLDILLYIFFQVPDWAVELRERERLMLDMLRLADQLGVQFAFPTQTLHLNQSEGPSPAGQHAVPTASTDVDALRRGVDAAREIVKDQAWQQEKPGLVTFTKGPEPDKSES